MKELQLAFYYPLRPLAMEFTELSCLDQKVAIFNFYFGEVDSS